MPDGASSSELWLLRTYFGEDDDAIWTSLTESARSTRSAVPGAELVVSSDRTQCQQRIRRVVARLATRAEANDGLYVALADKQTFARPDRSLLIRGQAKRHGHIGERDDYRCTQQHAKQRTE